MSLIMSGFLNYRESSDGWDDSISLLDGEGEKMGWMPLCIEELKGFHGKDVMITVEEIKGGNDGRSSRRSEAAGAK